MAMQSGAAGETTSSFFQADEKAVELIYNRDCRPGFLTDTSVVFSRQQELVLPVKDSNSDFAVNARKANQVESLKEVRSLRDRRKANTDALNVADSDMTKIVSGESDTAEAKDRLAAERQRERLRHASIAEREAILRALAVEEAKEMKEKAAFLQKPTPKGTDADTAPPLDMSPEEAAEQRRLALAKSLKPVRESLPIFLKRKELLTLVAENDVAIVHGETGSGKTTQVVQYLYEAGYSRMGLIGCTQPRRLAAMQVAKRVAEEMGVELGTKVGYTIRLEDRTDESTKVRFMTEGILLQEMLHDADLSKYSVIVIDEAHERNVDIDVLLGVLKDIQRRRSNLKLLITSATMALDKFSMFFGNAPIFSVSGRMYPVEIEYEKSPVADYIDTAVLRIVETHMRKPPGDILCFMTGKEDIEAVCELIKVRLTEIGPQALETLLVLPCHAVMPAAEMMRITEPAPEGKRKCIVATNVAETSLTIDGVVYVVDSGYHKCSVYNPNLGMRALQIFPIAQAHAIQRMGRAGRTREGICMRLYTQHQFESELLPIPVPEIQRSSIDSVILLLKSIGVRDLFHFDFLDPPPEKMMRNSLMRLWMLGAVDGAGEITADGKMMADLPAEPMVGKALLAAAKLNCAEEMISIVSMMAVDAKAIYYAPAGREAQASRAQEKFFHPESDHLTLLNILEQFKSHGQSLKWAEEHFLNGATLAKALEQRLQFREKVGKALKLPIRSCRDNLDVVRQALAYAYFPQTAKRKTWAEYTTMIHSVQCFLPKNSALNNAGAIADYVIYNDFMLLSQPYMTTVTAVDPKWIVEASHGMFAVLGDEFAGTKTLVSQSVEEARARILREEREAKMAIPTRESNLQQNAQQFARKRRSTHGL